MPLRRLVAGRIDPDHGHRALPQMVQRGAIQGTQVRRDHGDLGQARSCNGQQICQVGASSGDLGVRASLQSRDQDALPAIRDRGDDGPAHAPALVGDPGTGTRVILAPWSMAAMSAWTLASGTMTCTAVVPEAAPSPPPLASGARTTVTASRVLTGFPYFSSDEDGSLALTQTSTIEPAASCPAATP